MSQLDLDHMQHLSNVLSQLKVLTTSANNVTGSIRQELRSLKDKCDHAYPCGKSALVDSLMFNECSICGLTDI